MRIRSLPHTVFTWLPIVAVCALLGVNILLAQKVSQLQERISGMGMLERTRVEAPVGRKVPSFMAITHAGVPRAIEFSDLVDAGQKKTVLFVFSPQCGVCERTWPQWTLILERLKGTNIRRLFVDQSGTASGEYLERFGLVSEDVFTYLPPKTAALLQLGATPQIIVTSGAGEVLKVWTGALTPTGFDEVLASVASIATIQ